MEKVRAKHSGLYRNALCIGIGIVFTLAFAAGYAAWYYTLSIRGLE